MSCSRLEWGPCAIAERSPKTDVTLLSLLHSVNLLELLVFYQLWALKWEFHSKWVPYKGPFPYPELDKEEGISWPPFKQLLQAPFFLRELVIDLSDIHCLEIGIIVARTWLPNVHEQVFVILQEKEKHGIRKLFSTFWAYISSWEKSWHFSKLVESIPPQKTKKLTRSF